MKIAIIGTGNVGGALATKWSKAGHSIFLGVQDQKNFKGKHLLKNKNTTVASIGEAVKWSSVILLATPAAAVMEVAQALGDTTDKVIIDSMNIVGGKGPDGYKTTSLAILDNTSSIHLVKCFNTTGYNNMENPVYDGMAIDVFMAGDSQKAKDIAAQLAKDAGFGACYDIGGNDKFELMEQFAFFWINLAVVQGLGRDIGFKLLKR